VKTSRQVVRTRKFVLLIVFGFVATAAQSAGVTEFEIPADANGPAIHALMWTPCITPPKDIKLEGPIVVPGVRDCPISGEKLPLIVISHGADGSFTDHHDLAEILADGGFVVVALTHPHDAAPLDKSWLVERPIDVKRLVDYMLRSSPAAAKIDPRRVGFFGYSRGGYTGLILAGAVPDYPILMKIWLPISIWAFQNEAQTHQPGYDPRFKAFVLADPLTIFPNKDGLRNVTAPFQFWSSQSGGPGVSPERIAAVASDVPVRPELHHVPNSTHISFLMPCSPSEAKVAASEDCADPPGFDRATFHKEFDEQVIAFFRKHLP
jgi:predicted dienelactone hydrolase